MPVSQRARTAIRGAIPDAKTAAELIALLNSETQPKIDDPSGGDTEDAEARAAIVAIIDALEAHGITATS